jgi:serine/threonine protein kinase/beta-lactam-binding protein with PASTA domain
MLAAKAHTAILPTGSGAGVTMASVGDPLVGQVLDGRYQINRRLARGGMATVYQAVDTRLTRTVAVKVMHVGLGDDAEFARKFDREARAAARLSHPAVVSVFDQGQAVLDGHTVRPYIVMEYVEGLTLRDVILREAPMAPTRALEVFEPVLAALAAAHDAGLVHRDVKPENVLISLQGRIKVADFGLAKAISSQTSTATSGLLIGTVSYLPPELVLSGRADARSDVYSAGVVLFELLTGRKPHTGETPIQVAYAHVHNDVPPPSTVNRSGRIPPYLDALVAGATARDADNRPRDARVLLAQVRRVRAALHDGVTDDPELTQDLSALPTQPVHPDAEPTQRVASGAPTRGATPVDRYAPVPPTAGPGPAHLEAVRPPAALAPPPVVPAAPRPSAAGRAAAQREWEARRRRRGWLAVLLVLLLTTVALLAGWYLTEGRFTTAPALTRLSQADAERVAAQAGLELGVDEAHSESVPRGAVISTDPGPGTKIIDGGRVAALVSLGPEPKPVPVTDWTGRGADDAARVLRAAGFRVQVRAVHSGEVPAGRVVSQAPSSGTGQQGDPVELTRSLGPAMLTVPNVRAMGVLAAEQVLQDAGFRTRVRPAAVSGSGAAFVLATGPGARSRAPEGSVVTLYVF